MLEAMFGLFTFQTAAIKETYCRVYVASARFCNLKGTPKPLRSTPAMLFSARDASLRNRRQLAPLLTRMRRLSVHHLLTFTLSMSHLAVCGNTLSSMALCGRDAVVVLLPGRRLRPLRIPP